MTHVSPPPHHNPSLIGSYYKEVNGMSALVEFLVWRRTYAELAEQRAQRFGEGPDVSTSLNTAIAIKVHREGVAARAVADLNKRLTKWADLVEEIQIAVEQTVGVPRGGCGYPTVTVAPPPAPYAAAFKRHSNASASSMRAAEQPVF
jgi:hypothetical protein